MKYLFILILLFPSPVFPADLMNLGEMYYLNGGAQKVDIEMYSDPKGDGWYIVRMRWKVGMPFYYPSYGCSIASLNDFIARVNNKGVMNLKAFADTKTTNGKKWEWSGAHPPPVGVDPWCLGLLP